MEIKLGNWFNFVLPKHSIKRIWSTLIHKNRKTAFNCRVCGFDQGVEPWGEDGETPSFDICCCCGVQFGYEDCKEIGVREFRQEWINNGAKWFTPKDKPQDWSLEEQMKGIPDQFK